MNGDGASLTTEWMSAKQAAAILGGVSVKLVYKLYHTGELAGAKIGGSVRLRAASVNDYLERQSNQPDSPLVSGELCESKKQIRGRRTKKGGEGFTSYYLREMDRVREAERRRRRS